MTKLTAVRFKTYNPRRNLPPVTGRKRGESNFLGCFERYLAENVFSHGLHGRHFGLANYGIADLVWLLPTQDAAILHSFETKLTDWRQAFQQAYRYSYYSDASYVVLPPRTGAVAANYLRLFQTHGIGLWTYDTVDHCLTEVFTPEPRGARNPAAKSKAISVFSSRVNLC